VKSKFALVAALALIGMAYRAYGAETNPAAPLASTSWIQISKDPPTWVRDATACLLRLDSRPVAAPEPWTVIRSNPEDFTCVPNDYSVCLLNGRFQVALNYHLPGAPSEGKWALMQKISDTSALAYFQEGPTTVQALIDVLDACVPELGNHFWVFAGFLTNVGFDLTVTDSQGTQTKQYIHQPGPAAQAIEDTSAFASCP
jgi:hypothetical protein